MSIYMTEDEQVEAIKKWWKRYSTVVLISISVVMLMVSGVRYWSWHQQKLSQQASGTYEHMMMAFSNQDNKTVHAYANQLLHNYGRTVYADAARLTLAKMYVQDENFPKARQALSKVAKDSKAPILQQTAKIRLARLLIAEKSYDAALSELALVNDVSFLPIVNELKGDIYVAQKQYALAESAYRAALNEVQAKGLGNVFLEMKANDVSVLTQSA